MRRCPLQLLALASTLLVLLLPTARRVGSFCPFGCEGRLCFSMRGGDNRGKHLDCTSTPTPLPRPLPLPLFPRPPSLLPKADGDRLCRLFGLWVEFATPEDNTGRVCCSIRHWACQKVDTKRISMCPCLLSTNCLAYHCYEALRNKSTVRQ